jgi:hypothetical protein
LVWHWVVVADDRLAATVNIKTVKALVVLAPILGLALRSFSLEAANRGGLQDREIV